MEMEKVTLEVFCSKGQGEDLVQSLMGSLPANFAIYHWSSGVKDLDENHLKTIIKNTPIEILGRLIFVVHDKIYELEEADMADNMFGYDIYEDDSDDPINLGDIAYFDHEPTQKDVEKWLEDFQEIT